MEDMERLTDEELLQASGGLPQSYMGATADNAVCEQMTNKSSCLEKGCQWDKDHLLCINQ